MLKKEPLARISDVAGKSICGYPDYKVSAHDTCEELPFQARAAAISQLVS